MPLLHLLLQRLARKELSAALTVALEGVVNLSAFPKAVVDVAVVVLQVLMLQCAVV
jgi:ribonuclease PH